MLQGIGCGSVPVSIEYPRLAKKILSRCEHSVNLGRPVLFPPSCPMFLSKYRRYFQIVKLWKEQGQGKSRIAGIPQQI